jgi:hypothetical protein
MSRVIWSISSHHSDYVTESFNRLDVEPADVGGAGGREKQNTENPNYNDKHNEGLSDQEIKEKIVSGAAASTPVFPPKRGGRKERWAIRPEADARSGR